MSSPYFGNVQFISPLPAGGMEAMASIGQNAGREIGGALASVGQSLGEGLKQYYKNKAETDTARAGFEKAIAIASQTPNAFNGVNPEQLKTFNKLIAGKGSKADFDLATGQIVGQLTGFQQKQEQELNAQRINEYGAKIKSTRDFATGLQDLYSGNINKNPSYAVKAPVQPAVQGNIDLNARPVVQNQDGTVSTVMSFGVNIDGKEVLIPQVSDDGKILTQQEAIDKFKQTGKHLGIFNSVEESNAYAQSLHNQQAQDYIDRTQNPAKWAMGKLMQGKQMNPEDAANFAGAVANYYQKTPEEQGMKPSAAIVEDGKTKVSYETEEKPKTVPVEGADGMFQVMVGNKVVGTPFFPVKNDNIYDRLTEDKRKVADKFFQDLQNDPVYKAHGVSMSSIKKMENLGIGSPNYKASDDIALIFHFMKTLDPNSTVLQGEYANAQNAAGVPDRIINMYNNARKGVYLNDSQRNDFLNTARKNYIAEADGLHEKINVYRSQAEARGIPPELVDDLKIFNYSKEVQAKSLPRFQSEADAISSGTDRAMVLDPKTGKFREWVK